MSSSDKVFAEQLIEAGNKLLDPPSSVQELLPLLDKAEYYLSRVEQSPNRLIEDALSPCTKALVSDVLFRHPDTDVMVAVATCISEITRITAPEAPYSDQEMKEAFQLIVSSFEHLDDKSSRSYTKRTSILETMAKVRLCVVMLDLECDILILEMFRHFFNTIRDHHPELVFSSMETIITLVIEESEDISSELLSPILDTLKKNNERVLLIAKRLGEKVLQKCSTKLKAYLGQALSSFGNSVDDYSQVVSMICYGGTAENNTDATPAQEHEVENEAASPKSEVSNGVKQSAEDDSLADAVSTKPEIVPQGTRLKITGLLSKGKTDISVIEKEAKTVRKSKKSNRKRGRKWSSVKKQTRPTDSIYTHGKKEPGQSMENSDSAVRQNLPLDDSKETTVAPSPKVAAVECTDVCSPSESGETKNKEGSPLKESEGPSEPEVKENARLGERSGGGTSNKEGTPIKVKISKKISEASNSARTNMVMPSTEKVNASGADNEGSSPNSLKVKEKNGPAKGKRVHEKDMSMSSEKDEEKLGPLSKKMKKGHRNEDQPIDTPKAKGKRKRQIDEDPPVEIPKDQDKRKLTPAKEASDIKEYGEDLVGSKVKVWWPKDKAFYEGIVDSFDAEKKKHKILYSDGDVETLNLRKQRWEIIRDDSVQNEEQGASDDSRESTPEMPLTKLLKMMSKKKLSAKKGKGISSNKSEVVSPTPDNVNLDRVRGGKAKENNTANIRSKLIGLAQPVTNKSKKSRENNKEHDKTKEEKSKEDLEAASKGRTPKNVGKPKKAKSGGFGKAKSGFLKMKLKERNYVDIKSRGEPHNKEKSSLSKHKLKESKELGRDSGEDPSGKVESSSLKTKSIESKDRDIDSVEKPSGKVKSSSLRMKDKEIKEMNSDYGEEQCKKVESSPSKAKQKQKLRESEELENDPEELSDMCKSSPSEMKQKSKLRESKELAKDSEAIPDKEKSSTPEPKPKESEDVDIDSAKEPLGELKSCLLEPKPKESKDVGMDSGKETSDEHTSLDAKPKESEVVLKDIRKEPSEMSKSCSAIPKPKESEDVDMDSGKERSDMLMSSSTKLTPEESEDMRVDSGREPSDEAKSSMPKSKSKESEDVDEDSGKETSDKVKPSSCEPSPKENEDVNVDSGKEPSDEVKFNSMEPKPDDREDVAMDSGKELSGELKPCSLEHPKPKENEIMDMVLGKEPSDMFKSCSLKAMQKEYEDVAMDSGKEPSDEVMDVDSKKSEMLRSSSPESTPKEIMDFDMDSGEEPSAKGKSSSMKPVPGENEDLDLDSGEAPSDKVKSSSSEPKLNESEDVDLDSREDPSDEKKPSPSKPVQNPKLEESERVDKDSGEEERPDKVNSNSS